LLTLPLCLLLGLFGRSGTLGFSMIPPLLWDAS
jgi:hypothetical protein